MKTIPYQELSFFSTLIKDYLNQDEKLKSFYGYFPKLENFEKQIQLKKENYPKENRFILENFIRRQYQSFLLNSKVSNNISHLKNENTFTITTGHQLNLFTGPLYFLYKIISTIKISKLLNSEYPDYYFVPIYWMATEDHDFYEINHFQLHNKSFRWENSQTGAVGRFSTKSLSNLFNFFKEELGAGISARYLSELFSNSYLQHEDLASATRYIVNELFGKYGLVVVDGYDANLKSLFAPYFLSEIEQQKAFKRISEQSKKLSDINGNYPIQVHPREINLFYLKGNIRERIIKFNDGYQVLNTNLYFTKKTIREEIIKNPERFSPNVIIRPLYQEVVLPNLCYIGGSGELSYWLQLHSFFKEERITFPILLLRNSALLVTNKQKKRINKLHLSVEDLFLSKDELLTKKAKELSQINIDFSPQKYFLKEQFRGLYELAKQTDASFLNAVKAQEIKQIKGLNHLEKRLLKAQKKKWDDVLNRISALKEELFPEEGLQERKKNFSEFYLENTQLIDILIQNLSPLTSEFSILTI